MYKPKINYQSDEYYLIGLNYKTIDIHILDKLLDFLKDYKKIGFSDKIPEDFMAINSKCSPKLPKVIMDANKIPNGKAIGTKVVDIKLSN